MAKPRKTCSFCGKSEDQTRTLIAGPNVFICDQCIAHCNTILRQQSKPRRWIRSLLRRRETERLPEGWNQTSNLKPAD